MPATPAPHARTPASARHAFGAVLCRLIVPLWVLAGAAFKLYERNPGNLPNTIRDLSKSMGLEDLNTLLRVLIGLEFFAVAVMFFMPRYARAMTIFMLSCFCAILIREITTGAATCGCFGSLPIKPWQMLAIDGSLLLLVLFFPSGSRSAVNDLQPTRSGMALATAAVMLVVGMGIAVGVPNPQAKEQQALGNDKNEPITRTTQPGESPATQRESATLPNPDSSNQTQATSPIGPPAVSPTPSDPTINPAPIPLPPSWYTQKMDEWIGKPWRELEIFKLMPNWPREMDKGPRYIVFYGRTCDHCKTMLEIELVDPLDGLTTLVEVPASRDLMTDPNGWEMPMSVEMILGAELLQLPLGPNWVVTTPLIIKVVDGKVVCATEGGDHKKCLGLP